MVDVRSEHQSKEEQPKHKLSSKHRIEFTERDNVHVLREIHKRTSPSNVVSSPLPVALTNVSYLHTASLLPVTKAGMSDS
jgi:hypothetical protein